MECGTWQRMNRFRIDRSWIGNSDGGGRRIENFSTRSIPRPCHVSYTELIARFNIPSRGMVSSRRRKCSSQPRTGCLEINDSIILVSRVALEFFLFFFCEGLDKTSPLVERSIDRSIHPSREIGTVVETEIHLPQEKFKQNLTESSLTRSSNSFPRVNLQYLPLNLINTGLIDRPLLILWYEFSFELFSTSSYFFSEN